jgi:hypothetical protein
MIMMPYGLTLIITAAHRARRLLAPHRLITGMAFPVRFHPVSQGGPIHAELAGDLGDRARRLYHHPGGFLLELRREITAFFPGT